MSVSGVDGRFGRSPVPPDAGPSPPLSGSSGLVGQSKPMLEIFSRIEKVASSDASVCIYGESGTGKELIARAIHLASARRDRPLVTFDCTAVPEGLIESHLFGHVKGAFTGAVEHREGVFALAHTGTLFIDELSQLTLALQAKLLRVIQSREFVKVGGTQPLRADIRLITATNEDPKRGMEAGTFREDLYYRVAVVMIKVPTLRERREDIPLLIEHFARRYCELYRRPALKIHPSLMDRLTGLRWPGNVRHLENFVQNAVVLADGDTLTERDLDLNDLGIEEARATDVEFAGSEFESPLKLDEVERQHILRTLLKAGGNRTKAAKLLGISVRGLQYRLKSYSDEPSVPMPTNGTGRLQEQEHQNPGELLR